MVTNFEPAMFKAKSEDAAWRHWTPTEQLTRDQEKGKQKSSGTAFLLACLHNLWLAAQQEINNSFMLEHQHS